MKNIIILLVAFLTMSATSLAQMTTDNSYLRENYKNSKTAQKAAARKAARKARKAEKKKQDNTVKQESDSNGKQTFYVKTKDGSVTTKDKAATIAADTDTPYLAGAVPTTTEGIVCFERIFLTGDKSKQQVYDIMKETALEIIDSPEASHEISRIMQESGDTLIATICEPIYFKKAKWETDSALIRYQYFSTVKEGAATLRVWLISYSYEEIGFGYKAEEWITDKYALSKDRKVLRKGNGKFRKKTIDYVQALFARIEDRLKEK